MAMVYDVLHMMDWDERHSVYSKIYRLLKKDGILSVYPKHIATDHPLREFRNSQEEDVKTEIKDAGYDPYRRICGTLSYDEYLNEGCILNFRRVKMKP